MPDRLAVDRARALLMDVAARDPEGPLARGLERFGSRRSLAAVVGTDWLPIGGRLTASAIRVARRNLRVLGSPPAELGQVVLGEPVQLQGLATPLPGDGVRELWHAEVVDDADGRWFSDEGRDFLLVGRDAWTELGLAQRSPSREGPGTLRGFPPRMPGVALVLAAGGRLLNAERLQVGDEVSVFGTADEAPDRAGLAAAPRGGLVPALRSGTTRPLLVSVIRRYDQPSHGPPH
jgi:hypothetical protein